LCEKLNLTLNKHSNPYHVQWLSDKGNINIQHTTLVSFKIGPYEDTIECDAHDGLPYDSWLPLAIW
jgi:hypothetical protein